jgi:hypothetical protein
VGEAFVSIAHTTRSGWRQRLGRELVEYWASVLYMAVFFGVFITYRRLCLSPTRSK